MSRRLTKQHRKIAGLQAELAETSQLRNQLEVATKEITRLTHMIDALRNKVDKEEAKAGLIRAFDEQMLKDALYPIEALNEQMTENA